MLFPFRRTAVLSLALLMLASVSACRAQRRPGATPPASPRQAGALTPPEPAPPADLSLQVAELAAQGQPGIGPVDALVVGNVALIALPRVTQGIGRGPLNSPPDLAGRRGGGTNTGLTTRGGTPSATPGPPGHIMPPTAGGAADTAGLPGQGGTAMDMMTRVADHVRSRLPQIVEVRFLDRPEEAVRLRAVTDELRAGRPVTRHLADVADLIGRSVDAGTVWMPGGPPLGGHSPSPGTAPGARTGVPRGSP